MSDDEFAAAVEELVTLWKFEQIVDAEFEVAS